jgi:hypothetical protein
MKTIILRIPELKDLKPKKPMARALTKQELYDKARAVRGTVATKLRSMAAALEN